MMNERQFDHWSKSDDDELRPKSGDDDCAHHRLAVMADEAVKAEP